MTMRSLFARGALGMMLALPACQPPPAPSTPPSAADLQQAETRVQDYFKKTVTVPPNVTMKLADVVPATVPGLLTGNLEVSNGTQTQKVPLVLTRDGRFLIQGQLIDLTADPFKAVMEKINLKDLPVRGNPKAAVTIVEYSDFQCPFCSRGYKTLEDQVLKEYGDKVNLVFKNFPLTNIHPWAESAALAAVCARQQKPEAFWKLYDFLFQNQQTLTLENLKEKAQAALREGGFDADAFGACFDNKAGMDAVKAEGTEATTLGVRSTPTFFINGRKLEGAVPYENFKSVLDEALGVKAAAAAPGEGASGAGASGAGAPAAGAPSAGPTAPGGVQPG